MAGPKSRHMYWDAGTKSYSFQSSNTAENDLGGRRKSGKPSGSFTGPLMELISAEPLTWVVELVLGGTLTGLVSAES